MNRTARSTRGFSLIEMMIVIAIVSILLAISAGAFVRYFVNAKQRATETVITIIDDQLTQRVDSFWRRVNPPIRTRHAAMAGLGVIGAPAPFTTTNEAQAVRLRRANLLAKLEAMRGDFPQQFADFLTGSSGGLATCTNVASPFSDNAAAVASRTRAAIEAEYRRLTFEKNPTSVPNNAPRGQPGYNQITQIAPHNHWTESAACLYLMLKVGSGDGQSFDMGMIPPRHIQDTDGDGIPEIVDAWGTPLRFYRWPTDLIHSLATISGQVGGSVNALDVEPGTNKLGSNNQNTLDPERLLGTSEWIATTASQMFESNNNAGTAGMGNYFWISDHPPYSSNPPPAGRVAWSYPIYPIVISAGPDAASLPPDEKWQAFGLMWGPDPNAIPTTPIGSSTTPTQWPPVDDLPTRTGKIAQEVSTSYPGAGAHVDNIYSRIIQAGREAN